MLSRITPNLTQLELRLFQSGYQLNKHERDWGQLEQVLVRLQFPALRTIRVSLPGYTNPHSAEFERGWVEKIRANMSILDRRGVLDVVFKHPGDR